MPRIVQSSLFLIHFNFTNLGHVILSIQERLWKDCSRGENIRSWHEYLSFCYELQFVFTYFSSSHIHTHNVFYCVWLWLCRRYMINWIAASRHLEPSSSARGNTSILTVMECSIRAYMGPKSYLWTCWFNRSGAVDSLFGFAFTKEAAN